MKKKFVIHNWKRWNSTQVLPRDQAPDVCLNYCGCHLCGLPVSTLFPFSLFSAGSSLSNGSQIMLLFSSEPLKGFHSEWKSDTLHPCSGSRSSATPIPSLLSLLQLFSLPSPPWPPCCSQTQNLLPQGLCTCLEPSPRLQSPSPMVLTVTSFKSSLTSCLLKEVFLWPSCLRLQPPPSLHFPAFTTLPLFLPTYYICLPIYFAYYLSSPLKYKLHESRNFCLFKKNFF